MRAVTLWKQALQVYKIGAQILRDMGVRMMKLMTNNPAKYMALKGYEQLVWKKTVGRLSMSMPLLRLTAPGKTSEKNLKPKKIIHHLQGSGRDRFEQHSLDEEEASTENDFDYSRKSRLLQIAVAARHCKVGLGAGPCVRDAVSEVAAITGENVRLRRAFYMSSQRGIVSSYLHMSIRFIMKGLSLLAGLVSLEVEDGLAFGNTEKLGLVSCNACCCCKAAVFV
ncbi:hypothetical protein SELMODRAFT_411911 [Selaginella moellendorffii]|uniref:3,4-dihydroxy-2-butanone-4-phosphate synthase n=1 Tax=Selaginella moellendorffii TaxID=88036 RepID=D8RJF1_SELML|nr:hypothetical protein SELMODRAFT_411911 [Selaginella moellendorffii]